jgi:N-acetylglucosamine malate deacetylase 1
MINRKKVLCIMAHPDDAELLAMGSLLSFAQNECSVSVLIVCTGERGISVQDRDTKNLDRFETLHRYQESLHAFGGSNIQLDMLGFEDGAIAVNTDTISTIERKMKLFEPDVILTHFVDTTGIEHQDHTVVGRCVLNATIRVPSIRLILHPQPLKDTHTEFKPNTFVQLSEEQFQQKMKALACHQSQTGRYYLEADFHRHRCLQNALAANMIYHEQGLLFEAFYMSYQVNFNS